MQESKEEVKTKAMGKRGEGECEKISVLGTINRT